MVEISRVVVVLCAVVGMAVGAPAAAVGPARVGCEWSAELLPLPDNAYDGRVLGGAGDWLVGVADEQGVLWQDGQLVAAGSAFGLPTELLAVNGKGVAVGYVIGSDGRQHAVRYAGGYEYLPGSVAMDINESGDAVGYDQGVLTVWPAAGPARILDMPTGSVPYRRPVIDDDGTIVVQAGWIEGQKLRSRVYAWAPDGTRTPVPVGEVEDVKRGRVVGTSGELVAIGWGGGGTHVYRGGVRAVAVNDAGVVVGAGPAGEPLVWAGAEPTELPAPQDFYPGSVAAINDRDAGGFVSPLDDLGAVPVRWWCR
jgi:hypothetical protein